MNKRRITRVTIPICLLISVAYLFSHPNLVLFGGEPRRLTYSEFIQAVNDNNAASGSFDKHYFRGRLTKADQAFTVYLPSEESQEYTLLVEKLQAHNVRFEFREPFLPDHIAATIVPVLLPPGVIFVFWMFFLRQAQRNGFPRV